MKQVISIFTAIVLLLAALPQSTSTAPDLDTDWQINGFDIFRYSPNAADWLEAGLHSQNHRTRFLKFNGSRGADRVVPQQDGLVLHGPAPAEVARHKGKRF